MSKASASAQSCRTTVSAGAVARGRTQNGYIPVQPAASGLRLHRDGEPMPALGAGGPAPLALLKALGGNSTRTWASDGLGRTLDEAHALGLTVTAGIWLEHADELAGARYGDAGLREAQRKRVRDAVLQFRDHPALLIWNVGNEAEAGIADDPAVWLAIQDLAALVKSLDPNHPTMVVVAGLGDHGVNVRQIEAYCPSIDIIGINSYGGAPTVGVRYVEAGGTRPYILTEFGPAGIWERAVNEWGVVPELTSTQKAADYRAAYEGAVLGSPLCLGSYAFLWGAKQEATATWFGMLLPDGSRLAAADAMSRLWTGSPPERPCPEIVALALDGPAILAPGASFSARLDVRGGDDGPVRVEWVLQHDPATPASGGRPEPPPPTYPDAILSADAAGAVVRMPDAEQAYRLFAYVRDNHGGAATANVPLYAAKDPASVARRAASKRLAPVSSAGAAVPELP